VSTSSKERDVDVSFNHAILMHGVLVLPFVAWLAARIGWDERRQMRTVWAAIVLYAIAAAAIAAVRVEGRCQLS